MVKALIAQTADRARLREISISKKERRPEGRFFSGRILISVYIVILDKYPIYAIILNGLVKYWDTMSWLANELIDRRTTMSRFVQTLENRQMFANVTGPLHMVPMDDGLGQHSLNDRPGAHQYDITVTSALGSDGNYYLQARINPFGHPEAVEVVTWGENEVTSELTIHGADGNDNFQIRTANLANLAGFFSKNIEIEMDGGNDRVQTYNEIGYIYGGVGNDVLYGSNGNDGLVGGSGNDYIIAKNGDDKIRPGSGKDTVLAGGGDDEILYFEVELTADFYKDQIVGGTGFDTVWGLYDNPGGVTMTMLVSRIKEHGVDQYIIQSAKG